MECMRLQTRCAYHLTEENRREKSTSEAIRHAVEVEAEIVAPVRIGAAA